MKLFTIGYEGLKIDEFIIKLKENGVRELIDVRELPLSRKKGFSKTNLKDNLTLAHIDYWHLKEFGSPKPLRKKLYQDGDYVSFFKEYNLYLTNKEEVLEKLCDEIRKKTCCIMCFEKNPEKCHRSVLIKKITEVDKNGLKIVNI